MHPSDLFPPGTVLHFVRHGATAANLVGLRCGGDLDLPLTDAGRLQAQAAGRALLALQPGLRVIVSSDLQRTRETASLIAGVLGARGELPRLVIEPGFGERRLGDWNLTPTADTEFALRAGLVPPGGEPGDAFRERIAAALQRVRPLLLQPGQAVLLVGSKGVARVLGELAGQRGRLALDNGVLHRFALGAAQPEPSDLETT